MRVDRVLGGKSKSCGCKKGEHLITHNLSKHPLYVVWNDIKARCYNIKDPNYKNYGGRGITICEEWKNNFATFYKWSILHGWRKGLEIDRIDNSDNKEYSSQNCRFVTKIINGNNKRNNIIFTYNNKSQTISQWERERFNGKRIIKNRLKHGWSIQKILTTPLRKN